jgi:hypothetical protein
MCVYIHVHFYNLFTVQLSIILRSFWKGSFFHHLITPTAQVDTNVVLSNFVNIPLKATKKKREGGNIIELGSLYDFY